MFRASMVAIGVVTGFALVGTLVAADSSRTLQSGELFRIWGGAPVPDTCCSDFGECVGVAKTCGDYNQQDCPQNSAKTFYSGNIKGCFTTAPGTSCTEANTTHVCYQQFACVWDTTQSKCLQRSTSPVLTANAPDSCTPNCP